MRYSGIRVPGGTDRAFMRSPGTDQGPLIGKATLKTLSVSRPAFTTLRNARASRIGL